MVFGRCLGPADDDLPRRLLQRQQVTDNGYTPTQKIILKVLSDGQPHHKEELRSSMPDELCSIESLRVHITMLRKKLRPQKQDIICEIKNRRIFYRHVKLLFPSPE